MAANNYQPVIDPKTQRATDLYFNNGAYYRYDPKGGYIPTTDTPEKLAQQATATAQAQSSQYKNPINGINPRDYTSQVNQGYENLGQPAVDAGRDEAITYNAVSTLAKAFVDRYQAKAGKLPTDEIVKSFIAQNLTPDFTQKFITGIGTDQINAYMVDPYIEEYGDKIGIGSAAGSTESRLLGLKDELDKVYEAGKTKFIDDTETEYGHQKQGLVNDLSGQGMLTQPNSRISLDALEGAKAKSVASGIGVLAGQRAAGNVDLATTIENLLQQNQQIKNQSSQFNKTFNASRDDTYFNRGLQNRQLGMASQLGRLQGGAQSDNGLGGLLGGALGGASTAGAIAGTKAGAAIGPWGIAGGALIGGLGGYLSSRRK